VIAKPAALSILKAYRPADPAHFIDTHKIGFRNIVTADTGFCRFYTNLPGSPDPPLV
jgi:hypothetical protein